MDNLCVRPVGLEQIGFRHEAVVELDHLACEASPLLLRYAQSAAQHPAAEVSARSKGSVMLGCGYLTAAYTRGAPR